MRSKPFFLAWRILAHDKARTGLAIAGIFIAILLVFVEIGLYVAIPRGGLLLYHRLRFDLLVTSRDYEYVTQPGEFPAQLLDRARAVPQVARATPLYFGSAKWKSLAGGVEPDLFVIGFPPTGGIFSVAGIESRIGALEKPDTVLMDSATRPMFGPLTKGRRVEIAGRKETVAGKYRLGTGFLGLGVALTSAENFARLFPGRGVGDANIGLLRLRSGADPERAAAELRARLGGEVRIFTRPQLEAHEIAYWTIRTSVGLIFGSGLVVSLVVGIMIVFQTLSIEIGRRLGEFAMLKAIGYADGALAAVVLGMSLAIVLIAFVPATGAALLVYRLIRTQTLLPAAMSELQLAAVLGAALAMAAVSAGLALSGLGRANPAELIKRGQRF